MKRYHEKNAPNRKCSRCSGQMERHKKLFCASCSRDVGREKSRQASSTRRASVRSGSSEQEISIEQIAIEHGINCFVCAREVNMKSKHPDLLSASIEHVIPLVHGGTHTIDNLRVSHWWCNTKRRHSKIARFFGGTQTLRYNIVNRLFKEGHGYFFMPLGYANLVVIEDDVFHEMRKAWEEKNAGIA